MSAAALSSPLAARVRVARTAPLCAGKVAACTRRATVTVAAAMPAEKSNLVVIGGTGGTGAECVVQALKRGAKVAVVPNLDLITTGTLPPNAGELLLSPATVRRVGLVRVRVRVRPQPQRCVELVRVKGER